MNKQYLLSNKELEDLQSAHRNAGNNLRYGDRIKCVYLLGSGWTVTKVAEALMIDRETARNYFKRYRKGGLTALQNNDAGGSNSSLNKEQLEQLSKHLDNTLFQTAKEIACYIEKTWQVSYSESGITQLLHRIGFVYKKPKLVPGKTPDVAVQLAFIDQYKALKDSKSPNDPIYFMDATHPHHNPIAGWGWIRRGHDFKIETNTGRQRININGVIDVSNLQSIVRYDDTINAQSTILLFQQIEALNPEAEHIYIYADNAKYYKSKLVQEYLKSTDRKSKIILDHLPPYGPNLNIIERYWKFFKKKVLYGKYYEKFDFFKQACDTFFSETGCYEAELRTLLTDNFQIITRKQLPNFQVQ